MKLRTLKLFLTALAILGLTVAWAWRFSIIPSHAQTGDSKQSDGATQSDGTMSCPKCKGPFEAGMIRDYWNQNSFDPTYWSPAGERQHLFSLGKRIRITVYRCSNCGYLESYAK